MIFIFPVLLISFALAYNEELIDPQFINVEAYCFWISILPPISLLFFNGCIIAIIKRRINLQRTQTSHERNSTKILFGIVLLFLIFHIPRVVHHYHGHFYHVYQNTEYFEVLFVRKTTSTLALMMNSSVNFMVGSNFQAEFVQIFRCKKTRLCSIESQLKKVVVVVQGFGPKKNKKAQYYVDNAHGKLGCPKNVLAA